MIDWTIFYNNTLMRSFSDENESIINGWGDGEGGFMHNMRGLERHFGGAIWVWWQQHFLRKKTCKLKAKRTRLQGTGSSFFKSVYLCSLQTAKHHWCKHHPSPTLVIMLLASAWLKDLICKLGVQHLPTSSSTLSLFSDGTWICSVMDSSQWSTG